VLQTLRCMPLESDVGCASGKNIDCAYRKARVRYACCSCECLCSMPGRNCELVLLPTVSPAPPALLPLVPSALLGGASVGGAGGVRICFISKSDMVVSQNTLRGMHIACGIEHDDRSDRQDLRARDADGGSYRRRVAGRLPRSTSLALGWRFVVVRSGTSESGFLTVERRLRAVSATEEHLECEDLLPRQSVKGVLRTKICALSRPLTPQPVLAPCKCLMATSSGAGVGSGAFVKGSHVETSNMTYSSGALRAEGWVNIVWGYNTCQDTSRASLVLMLRNLAFHTAAAEPPAHGAWWNSQGAISLGVQLHAVPCGRGPGGRETSSKVSFLYTAKT
jgi:hypothetical protein